MDNLRQCPFCGGKGNLYRTYSRMTKLYFVFVKCMICGSQGKTYSDPEDPIDNRWDDEACTDAATAWNMRTDEREAE